MKITLTCFYRILFKSCMQLRKSLYFRIECGFGDASWGFLGKCSSGSNLSLGKTFASPKKAQTFPIFRPV